MTRQDSTQELFIKGADLSQGSKGLYTFYHDGFLVSTTNPELYGMLVRDSVVRCQKQGRKEKLGSIEDAGFALIPELSMKYLLDSTMWATKARNAKGRDASIKRLVTGDFASYEAVLPTRFTNAVLFSSNGAVVDGKTVEGDTTMIMCADDNRKRMLGFVDSVVASHMTKYGAEKYPCMRGITPLNVSASFGNERAILPYNGVYDNRTKLQMTKRMLYQGILRAQEAEIEEM